MCLCWLDADLPGPSRATEGAPREAGMKPAEFDRFTTSEEVGWYVYEDPRISVGRLMKKG